MTTRVSILVAATLGFSLASAQAAEVPESTAPPVQAIWKQQQVDFYFQSFTTFYSCSSLEAKLRRILTAVGVNRNMKIRTRGCLSAHDIARMPFVEIMAESAVEATPEALADRDKNRSTRELAARVRGETKEAEEAERQFPAQWKQVSLSRGKLYLEPGDCELVEQIKDKVLPKLAVRVVDDDLKCTPNQLTMSQPKLIVEALVAMPKPDDPTNTKR